MILESGEEKEKEREINIDQLPLAYAPNEDQTCNAGICPDQESNLKPLGLQDDAQTNEPHQPGMIYVFLTIKPILCIVLNPFFPLNTINVSP